MAEVRIFGNAEIFEERETKSDLAPSQRESTAENHSLNLNGEAKTLARFTVATRLMLVHKKHISQGMTKVGLG